MPGNMETLYKCDVADLDINVETTSDVIYWRIYDKKNIVLTNYRYAFWKKNY